MEESHKISSFKSQIENFTQSNERGYLLIVDNSNIDSQKKEFLEVYIKMLHNGGTPEILVIDLEVNRLEIEDYFNTSKEILIHIVEGIPLQKINLDEQFYNTYANNLNLMKDALDHQLKRPNSKEIYEYELFKKQLIFSIENEEISSEDSKRLKNELEEVQFKLKELKTI